MAQGNTRREKLHICAVDGCGKRYDRPAKLADHLRIHTGERPFICSVCSATFTRKKELSTHMLKHLPSEKKPLKCPECGKGLNSRQHQQQHMRTHLAAGSLLCPICQRGFTRAGFLNRHISQHPTCLKCGEHHQTSRQLRTHVRHNHEMAYICGACSQPFDTALELQEHLSSHEAAPSAFLTGNLAPRLQIDGDNTSAYDGKGLSEPEFSAVPTPQDDNSTQDVDIAPTISRLTGHEYDLRPIECPHRCGYRFKRQYDLARHINAIHSPK